MFDQKRYNADQCKAIQIYKWNMSALAGRDLGKECIREWINKYAQIFREVAILSGEYSNRQRKIDMVEFWAQMFYEMQKYKWIESEKAGKDLGIRCEYCWIEKYANKFLTESILTKKFHL